MMTEFLITSEEQLLKDGDKLVLRPQQTRLDGEGDRLVVSKYDEGIPDWQKAEENPTKARDEVRPKPNDVNGYSGWLLEKTTKG